MKVKPPYDRLSDGVRLRVRLTPKASRDAVKQVVEDEKGVVWLTATVTAVPENGRANQALVKLLAKRWRLAKSLIKIVGGSTDRKKSLHISGDPIALAEVIDTEMK